MNDKAWARRQGLRQERMLAPESEGKENHMNYGYDPTPFDDELAAKLTEMVDTLEPDSHGMQPYVERDLLYPGVRIRRITHYTDERRGQIVSMADAIRTSIGRKHGETT